MEKKITILFSLKGNFFSQHYNSSSKFKNKVLHTIVQYSNHVISLKTRKTKQL